MDEVVDSYGDFRTPDEQRAVSEFHSRLLSGRQWQVWKGTQLISTWLSADAAEEEAKHIWRHKGYTEFRFSEGWNGPGYSVLEILGPGNRFMTSDTFVVMLTNNHERYRI
jgi:hypothetical protein